MAIAAEEQGDLASTLQCHIHSLAASRLTDDRFRELIAALNVGVGYRQIGAFEMARQHLDAALPLSQMLAYRESEGFIQFILFGVLLDQGHVTLALARAELAASILEAAGSRCHLTEAVNRIGDANTALELWEPARAAFDRAEQLARETEAATNLLNALAGQIRHALAQGDFTKAQLVAERLLHEPATTNGISGLEGLYVANHERILLSLCKLWQATNDPRADAVLVETHRALMVKANAIGDAALRQGFLENFPENREIMALWAAHSRQA